MKPNNWVLPNHYPLRFYFTGLKWRYHLRCMTGKAKSFGRFEQELQLQKEPINRLSISHLGYVRMAKSKCHTRILKVFFGGGTSRKS